MKKVILILILFFTLFLNTVYSADISTTDKDADISTGEPDSPKSTTPTQSVSRLQNPLNATSVQGIVSLIVDLAIYIGVSFAILAIIYVGFQFVMAQGNPKKIEDAKHHFFYIIIGLAILISARVIVEIVENTLIQSGVVNEKLLK